MLAGWIWLHGMVELVCWLVGSCCCSYGWHPACRQRHEKCIACIIFSNHYGSIGKDQVESMIIGSCQHSTCIIGQLWFTMEATFMVRSSRFIAGLRCSIARTPCSQCDGSSGCLMLIYCCKSDSQLSCQKWQTNDPPFIMMPLTFTTATQDIGSTAGKCAVFGARPSPFPWEAVRHQSCLWSWSSQRSRC